MNNLTDRIGEKIVSGDFVVDLIKPVYSFFIYWSTSLGRILASIVTRGLPLLIIFSPALFHIEFNMVKVIFFISVCTLDYILLSMLYILTGYLAFFVIEIWPFSRMLGDTIRFFSGAIIPIAFFPSWLADFTKLLPFHLFYSFPIRILLEDLPLNELLKNTFLIGMWGLFFFWVLVMIYKRAIWHSVVQGG